jgi:hypothetical protein
MKQISLVLNLTRAKLAAVCIAACIAAPVLGAFATQSIPFLSPPTISDVPDQVVQKNGTLGPLAFTVGDADDPTGNSLTMSGTSSNTTLVPNANIIFGGSGNSRTLTITPAANLIGTTLITLTVTDADNNTASDTFNLKVNAPPHFDANTGLTVNQGATGAFSTGILNTTDADNTTAQIVYTIASTGGGPPAFGLLKRNGVTLAAGGTFTQADVDNGLVTYIHDDSNNFNDSFQIGISDTDGGIAADGTFTSFTVNITITPVNHPPTAIDGNGSTPPGVVFNGTLQASDPDTTPAVQTLTRRITVNGTKGTAVLDDATTGAFHYTPNAGQTGQDSITFQVNDGLVDAPGPGTFTIDIVNHPPVAVDGSGTTPLGTVFNGTFDATDSDIPAQTLTRRITVNGTKGTAVLDNATTGAFHYTPTAGQSGQDMITFQVNDGLVDAATPGTFTITIQNQAPTTVNGTGSTNEGVALNSALSASDPDQPPQTLTFAVGSAPAKGVVNITDVHTGAFTYTPNPDAIGADSFTFTANDGTLTSASSTFSVFIHPNLDSGDLLVTSSAANIGSVTQIDPANGMQALISTGGNLVNPQGIALDHSGNVIVGDNNNNNNNNVHQLIKIDRATGNQTVIPTVPTYQVVIGVAIGSGPDVFVTDPIGGAIYQLNPTTGAIDAQCGSLSGPAGITFDKNGVMIVGFAGFIAGQPSRVSTFNMATCTETVISTGGSLFLPVGVSTDGNNDVIVGDAPTVFGGPPPNKLIHITRSNGNQTVVSTSVGAPTGITVNRTTNDTFSTDNSSVNVNKTTSAGATTVVASGENIIQPFALTMVGLLPTAAGVSVSGRVTTSDGRPIGNVRVELQSSDGPVLTTRSNAFGYYRFDSVRSGNPYVLGATARGWTFRSRVLIVSDTLAGEDMMADQ